MSSPVMPELSPDPHPPFPPPPPEYVTCWVKVFDHLGKLVPSIIHIAKTRAFWEVFTLIPEIRRTIADAKCSMPELANLDQQDAMIIASAAYECLKKIIAAIL